MPALFAYLLSISVFVGAGYAGLVWLTEPLPAKPSATSTVGSAYARPKLKHEAVAADDASPRDPASSSEPAASAPNAPAPQPQPAAEAASEAKPEQHAQEPREEARQLPRQDRSKDNHVADSVDGTTPVAASGHALRGGPDVIATAEHQQPGSSRETPPLLPKPVLSPKAANAVAQWFGAHAAERHARPKPRETMVRAKQHSVREASRSRYVMMTLRTIEYPDGHRERRLLPVRQFWAESD
jgi:hypothetical protein